MVRVVKRCIPHEHVNTPHLHIYIYIMLLGIILSHPICCSYGLQHICGKFVGVAKNHKTCSEVSPVRCSKSPCTNPSKDQSSAHGIWRLHILAGVTRGIAMFWAHLLQWRLKMMATKIQIHSCERKNRTKQKSTGQNGRTNMSLNDTWWSIGMDTLKTHGAFPKWAGSSL